MLAETIMKVAETIMKGLFGAIFAIGFEKSHNLFKLHKEVKSLRAVFPFTKQSPKFSVKCSMKIIKDGTNPPSLRSYVHSAEIMALHKIAKSFHEKPVTIKFDSFYSSPQENQNLLLIGASAYNEISRHIMADMGPLSLCKSNDSHSFFKLNKTEYRCKHTSCDNAKVVEDYGIILRKSVYENNIVLLLGGIHMHGTLAAAEVALSSKFQQTVKESKNRFFVQLVKTSVMEDGFSLAPNAIIWEDYPLIVL